MNICLISHMWTLKRPNASLSITPEHFSTIFNYGYQTGTLTKYWRNFPISLSVGRSLNWWEVKLPCTCLIIACIKYQNTHKPKLLQTYHLWLWQILKRCFFLKKLTKIPWCDFAKRPFETEEFAFVLYFVVRCYSAGDFRAWAFPWLRYRIIGFWNIFWLCQRMRFAFQLRGQFCRLEIFFDITCTFWKLICCIFLLQSSLSK